MKKLIAIISCIVVIVIVWLTVSCTLKQGFLVSPWSIYVVNIDTNNQKTTIRVSLTNRMLFIKKYDVQKTKNEVYIKIYAGVFETEKSLGSEMQFDIDLDEDISAIYLKGMSCFDTMKVWEKKTS